MEVLSRATYEVIEVVVVPSEWPTTKKSIEDDGYSITGYLPHNDSKWLVVCRKRLDACSRE